MVAVGTKIRVLIADDHPAMREGLSAILSQEDDIQIVGKAKDGLEAIQMARDFLPDVILMDLSMPKLEGMEAAQVIRTTYPNIRVIALSIAIERDTSRIRNSWASDYINKAAPLSDLLKAIRTSHI
jgi:DNA-binding NarL/FixJ family response regulator